MPDQNGADVILELLRAHEIDCVFASPIAVMAPVWEALAARREQGKPEAPRYFQCRHESLAVALASGYYKASGARRPCSCPPGSASCTARWLCARRCRSARP